MANVLNSTCMCVYVCVRENRLHKHASRLLLVLERVKVDAVLREAPFL